jgi:ABC-type uncharacterized transport system ATPase subunit
MAASHTPVPRLVMRGISKSFLTVLANDSVHLSVGVGEIHALIGENGAGKSTLMKIACGALKPDAGSIEWEGRAVTLNSPAAARRLGIGMVFQNFALFETLSVAENIALAVDEKIPAGELARRIRTVGERYGLPLDPFRLVHSMSVGERQRVEIVRCLLQTPKLLIMDEPTSILSPQAVTQLFETLRRLAAEGMSILYISHKLEEVRALCDRATVLRNGKVTGTANPRQETTADLARLMIGAALPEHSVGPHQQGAVRLDVRDFSLESREPFGTTLHAMNLQVHGGEIVGIAGISGNGQRELLAALSGENRTPHQGSIHIDGRRVDLESSARRRELGLGFVPEERLGRGAVPSMSMTDNALLTGARAGMVRGGFVRRHVAAAAARSVIAEFDIKADEFSVAERVSGGNLQKFIVGREILLAPKVLLAAQPTWGVDVAAAQSIHRALVALRDTGAAILVVSEDLDELFALCDRICVIANGVLSAGRPRSQLNVETIGTLMAGVAEAARYA